MFISYWLLGVGMAYLSQFVYIEEAIKRIQASLASPLIGHWLYEAASFSVLPPPAAHMGFPDEGKPRAPITVVLATDDDLAAYYVTYPLSYGFHADRIESIAAAGPQAIFIDYLFLDERDDHTIGDLVETLCSINHNIPVFLASLDYSGQPLRGDLEAAAKKGCFTKVAVPRTLDRYDRQSWEYRLRLAQDAGGIDSAALAIYRRLALGAMSEDVELPNLALVWGIEPHAYNLPRMKREKDGAPLCRAEWRPLRELPPLQTVWQTLAWLSPERFDDGYQNTRMLPFCPYQASIPLNFLSAKPDLTRHLLKGRVVMYGADLQSVGDISNSPLHGAIPGVFVHAMALDNLWVFKDRYPRAIDFNPFSAPFSAGTIFPLFMVSLVAGMAAGFHKARKIGLWASILQSTFRFDGRQRRMATTRGGRVLVLLRAIFMWAVPYVAKSAFYLVVLLIVGGLAMHVFSIGTLSWIEYAVIPMILEVFHSGDRFAAQLERAWNYLAGSVAA